MNKLIYGLLFFSLLASAQYVPPPLPQNASQETGGNLASINSKLTGISSGTVSIGNSVITIPDGGSTWHVLGSALSYSTVMASGAAQTFDVNGAGCLVLDLYAVGSSQLSFFGSLDGAHFFSAAAAKIGQASGSFDGNLYYNSFSGSPGQFSFNVAGFKTFQVSNSGPGTASLNINASQNSCVIQNQNLVFVQALESELPAGTQIIGKTGIDSTSDGSTNKVFVSANSVLNTVPKAGSTWPISAVSLPTHGVTYAGGSTIPVSTTINSVITTVPAGGSTWPISGTVSLGSSIVNVGNFPAVQAVTGTFFQNTQPVSIATTVPVSFGSSVSTYPVGGSTWPVSTTINSVITTVPAAGSTWNISATSLPTHGVTYAGGSTIPVTYAGSSTIPVSISGAVPISSTINNVITTIPAAASTWPVSSSSIAQDASVQTMITALQLIDNLPLAQNVTSIGQSTIMMGASVATVAPTYANNVVQPLSMTPRAALRTAQDLGNKATYVANTGPLIGTTGVGLKSIGYIFHPSASLKRSQLSSILVNQIAGAGGASTQTIELYRITAQAATPGGSVATILALDPDDTASTMSVIGAPANAPTRLAGIYIGGDLPVNSSGNLQIPYYGGIESMEKKPYIMRVSTAEGYEIVQHVTTALTTAPVFNLTFEWTEE